MLSLAGRCSNKRDVRTYAWCGKCTKVIPECWDFIRTVSTRLSPPLPPESLGTTRYSTRNVRIISTYTASLCTCPQTGGFARHNGLHPEIGRPLVSRKMRMLNQRQYLLDLRHIIWRSPISVSARAIAYTCVTNVVRDHVTSWPS